jgi:hypothetical protein
MFSSGLVSFFKVMSHDFSFAISMILFTDLFDGHNELPAFMTSPQPWKVSGDEKNQLAWLVVPQKIDPVITIYEIASSFSSLP